MEIDFAYLRRTISVSADTENLKLCLEDWIKMDKRFFFNTYPSKLVYQASYFLYKNIAEAIIEKLGDDLIIVQDVDYMDSAINTYFDGFPDIDDAIVRKQLSQYISDGAQCLFTKITPMGENGVFPGYLDQELKKSKILKADETCILLSGHTCNPKYAKKAYYRNMTYFLTNVFNPEILNLFGDYMIWMKQEVLKDMRYCFDQYYRYYEDCDSLEDFKVKEWDRINSSNEEREKFIAFYIDDYINNNDKQYFELLSERFEYDNNFMWFLGKDIFTDWDKVWDELSSR